MNTKLGITLAALAGALFLNCAPAAVADETTVTTTTTTRSDPAPATVVTVPAHPAETTIIDEPSCTKEKVTKTDEDTGDSVTKTKTTCD